MKHWIWAIVFCALSREYCEGSDIWFFHGMDNPGIEFFLYPVSSGIQTVDTEKYQGAPVLEVHLAGEAPSGVGFKRQTEYNFASDLRNAKLKFACRAITDPSTLKVALLTSESDHRQLISQIEKPITAEKKWTEVSIPLTDFLKDGAYHYCYDAEQQQAFPNPDTPFDMRRVQSVKFENDALKPCDIYIADVRIEVAD